VPKGQDDPRQRGKKSEAEIVDKLLRQLPHADPTLGNTGKTKRQVTPKGQMPSAKPLSRPDIKNTPPSPLKTWAWVALSLLVAIGMTQWPYGHTCGWGLLGYLTVVTVVLAAAGWGTVSSWRSHRAVAHVLALGAMTLSTVLIVREVLPRVGYAKIEATWSCPDESAAPAEAAPSDSPEGVLPQAGAVTPTGPPPEGAAPADREPPRQGVDSTPGG
jgi:hypothetical protein